MFIMTILLFTPELLRWYKIKYQGNVTEYNKIQNEYTDANLFSDEFLRYALIMADKYHYSPAYMDVYWALYDKQNLSHNDTLLTLDSLNIVERRMALKYLWKAKMNGDFQSMQILGKYYLQGKYFKKDSIIGQQLLNESEKLFK